MEQIMSSVAASPAAVIKRPGWAAVAAAAWVLAGCGGGSTAATDPAPTQDVDNGLVYIGLTDAEGDFASYTVDVLSIALERANGTCRTKPESISRN